MNHVRQEYLRRKLGWGLIVVLLLALFACSPAEGPAISVEGVWGRPSPKVAAAGAFYMVIQNEGSQDDKLVGGSSPACEFVELHEAYLTEEGAMGMRPVTGGVIEIPAGGEAELKPGGLHVMCINKLADFEVGAMLDLTLEFEQTGKMTLEVEIREP